MRDPRPPDRSSAARAFELQLTELDRKIAHAGAFGAAGEDGVTGGIGASGQFNLMTSGRWYVSTGGGRSQTAIQATAGINGRGRTTAVPFFVSLTTVFDAMAVQVFTAKTSGLIRLGIYADTGNGSPGGLVRDCGTIDASVAGERVTALSPALTLAEGIYWLSACDQTPGTSASTQPLLQNLKDASYCTGYVSAATALPATVFTPAMTGYISTNGTNATGGLSDPYPAVLQAAGGLPLIAMHVQ